VKTVGVKKNVETFGHKIFLRGEGYYRREITIVTLNGEAISSVQKLACNIDVDDRIVVLIILCNG
jgi:hypothetical protein